MIAAFRNSGRGAGNNEGLATIKVQTTSSLKKKKKYAILLVLPFDEISIQPELSSPPHFRIKGGYPEFLKAAIMQSHDCAKYLRICASFGLMNPKQERLALISCNCHHLTKYF